MLEVAGVGMTYQPARGLMRVLVRGASDQPVRALDDVTFRVDPGEVVGLVGPNGAGKTTLIRAITTLLIPTDGTIHIDGHRVEVDDRSCRTRFGLSLPQDRSFHWRLTGRQNLRYFGTLAGIAADQIDRRVDEAMAERGLAERDKALFGYSSGMIAQLGIARALLHDPPLVILDEPTRSLDPIAGAELCDQIRSLAADGRAVLMSNHRLDEVVAACDRVLALVNGRIVWAGTVDEVAGDPGGLGARLRSLVTESAGAA